MSVPDTDVLILGSGLAGLSLALKLADSARVTIVTKDDPALSNSAWAQGGIAAVFDPNDSFAEHARDTHTAGAGLCDPAIVDITVREGPDRVRELIEWGVNFDRREEGGENHLVGSPTAQAGTVGVAGGEGGEKEGGEAAPLDLTREGGHGRRRVLHVRDFTGRAVIETLLARAAAHPRVTILAHHMAVDLLLRHKLGSASSVAATAGAVGEGSSGESRRFRGERPELDCVGAWILNKITGEVRPLVAPVTFLATGGCGKVYLYTSNPDTATGDGIALAWRAGARIGNMEFMQFHPTCLYHPQAKSFLVSEALRGEGGVLIRRDGTAFMAGHHPLADLAPRDIVARAIDAELKRSGDDCVYLDMTRLKPEFVRERFPHVVERCASFGIDAARDPIPVVPAAHYACGGVLTDEQAQTNIRGLLAAGEVACTGLHGANRLASNSLLEALVFAHRAATTALALVGRFASEGVPTAPAWDHGRASPNDEGVVVSQPWDEVRRLMWNYVGIVRGDLRLERALDRLRTIRREVASDYWKYRPHPDLLELRNLADVAELIVRSAQMRRESRGLHYNIDHPRRDDTHFARPTIL